MIRKKKIINLDEEYASILDWLFNLFPDYHKIGFKAYKPGLSNIYNLLSYFNNPQDDLTFIHVAGTNGKGSTCSMLSSILTESGNKVGLFTSPHIMNFEERIRINGSMIDKNFVIRFSKKIQNTNFDFKPSFFEISFAMALVYFQQNNCNICVIETGLGGRLDATNCIIPIISLITNISYEHTNLLGNTLEEIAFEKAGIIKENIPVVIGKKNKITDSVFKKIAKEKKSEIYFISDEKIVIPDYFNLNGEYQIFNYKLVLKALELIGNKFFISKKNIENGLLNLYKNTGFYGRLQLIEKKPDVYIDVSHNEYGIKQSLKFFKSIKNLNIVFGISSDKDLDSIFKLFPKKANYYFTEFSNKRSVNIEDLKKKSVQLKLNSEFFKNPLEAFNKAKQKENEDFTILIIGSFYLISDFLKKYF